MFFIAIIIAAVIVYLIQKAVYDKKTFENLDYSVSLSAEEVFEGEDIFMYEEITNAKKLPVSSVRVDTELPKGLCFRLGDKSVLKNKGDEFKNYIQSAFVLKGNSKIKRRWRINCMTRGTYNLGRVLIVSNDLFGFNANSKAFDAPRTRHNQVVVLPRAIDLDSYFTSSYFHSGEVTVMRSLLSDPLRIAGAREYMPNDPMNRINWTSSAVHGKLMVNVEEYTEQYLFNIILNMQSRSRELHPHEPSSPEYIEMCITVCASILDKISSYNIPVRLLANTPPASVGLEAISDDEIGSQILVTKPYRGKNDILNVLRMLASLKTEISCQTDKMLDHIAGNPFFYANNGNMIVISSYIDERMIVFHDVLEKQGVKVIFYITTANQNAIIIPNNIKVFFKTYIDKSVI
ncbi:MAG: DUF58 domain-containing protein [Eubacteriales bacterium]|jgi:hypothetical protein|nr:DUF58 domain-containing protein [Eubacteriales bacterium]